MISISTDHDSLRCEQLSQPKTLFRLFSSFLTIKITISISVILHLLGLSECFVGFAILRTISRHVRFLCELTYNSSYHVRYDHTPSFWQFINSLGNRERLAKSEMTIRISTIDCFTAKIRFNVLRKQQNCLLHYCFGINDLVSIKFQANKVQFLRSFVLMVKCYQRDSTWNARILEILRFCSQNMEECRSNLTKEQEISNIQIQIFLP